MMTLNLSEIALAVGGELFGNGEKTICGISTDSRKTMPEEIFIALRGEIFDGHDFIQDLWGRCAAVITERRLLTLLTANKALWTKYSQLLQNTVGLLLH